VDKDKVFYLLYTLLLILLYIVMVAGLGGCATTRTKSAANGDVLSYQAEITRLEDTIANYQHEIGYTIEELGSIRERASGVEGTIDEIIYLFDEYQRRVDEVLRRYRTLQANFGRENSSLDLSSNLYDSQSNSSDSGVHSVLQGNKSSEMD